MDLAKTIGERVKKLRDEELKISQEDLARQLGDFGREVTQGQIGHIESGRKLPSIPLLVAMVRKFETSSDYLLGLTDNQLSPADIEEELRTGGLGGRLGEIFGQLPADKRQQVATFAEALLIVERQGRDGEELDEDHRRMGALLNVLERRVGKERAEQVLEDLALMFPGLYGSSVGAVDTKQKRA